MKKNIIIKVLFFCVVSLFFSNIRALEKFQIVNKGGENFNDDGIIVSKTIEYTGYENYFDITLKVSAPDNIEKIYTDQDLSIVIVMDISNTMVTINVDGTLHEDNKDKITRYDAAINAGEQFIKKFYNISKNTQALKEIGYVAFNSDAKEIFALSQITNENLNEFINQMKYKTNNMITETDYNSSKKRFTNIEAGLKMAYDMLKESKSKNKYIIILSDGFPTTYIKEGYIGYDTYTPLASSSQLGEFYNSNKNLPCSNGVSYSDQAAISAQNISSEIKNDDIVIFSIGVGLENQQTVSELSKSESGNFSIIDCNKKEDNQKNYGYDYVIGNNIEDFKNWLKYKIGSGYYFDTNETDKLIDVYSKILTKIENINKKKVEPAWVINDAMNNSKVKKFIEFIGLYNNSGELVLNIDDTNEKNIAFFSQDKLNWDLKKSNYVIKEESDNKKIYNYTLKYQIRLKNEHKDFLENNSYFTNGDTFLTYYINKNDTISEPKTIDFKIPQVNGYLSNLTFLKVSDLNEPISGVKFKLVHDINNCTHKTNVDISDMYVVSDEQGVVSFENIPSGHNYILTEVETLENYIKDDTKYEIIVSYGELKISPELSKDENNNYLFKNILKSNNPQEDEIINIIPPNTGDNVAKYLILFIVSVILIFLCYKKLRKVKI